MALEFLSDSGPISETFAGTTPDFDATLPTIPTGADRVAVIVVTFRSDAGESSDSTISLTVDDAPVTVTDAFKSGAASIRIVIGAVALAGASAADPVLHITGDDALTGSVKYRVVVFTDGQLLEAGASADASAPGSGQSVELAALGEDEIYFALSDFTGLYQDVQFDAAIAEVADWTIFDTYDPEGGNPDQLGGHSNGDVVATEIDFSVTSGGAAGNLAVVAARLGPAPAATDFNCVCDDDNATAQTRAQLRRRMLVRLGYAAQADSPPPGMADLLNDFLYSAQTVLYQKHVGLRQVRFFTWTMAAGVRFYDLPENDEVLSEECAKLIDILNVQWVGIEDMNGTWLPLRGGIAPEYYTSVTRLGIPSLYEIRQCIEVFPAPDRAYKLRVKAGFRMEAFTADDARTTIDSELVFLQALADAKDHYGQPDAASVQTKATAYLMDLKAGKHLTNRYVPQSEPRPNLAQPIFLPRSEP